MEYSAYDELMSYFYFEFNLYTVLTAIVILGLTKSIFRYVSARRNQVRSTIGTAEKIGDLSISFIAFIGLVNAMMFQGVLADIPVKSGHIWGAKTIPLFVISGVCLVLQLLFLFLSKIEEGSKPSKESN